MSGGRASGAALTCRSCSGGTLPFSRNMYCWVSPLLRKARCPNGGRPTAPTLTVAPASGAVPAAALPAAPPNGPSGGTARAGGKVLSEVTSNCGAGRKSTDCRKSWRGIAFCSCVSTRTSLCGESA